LLLILEISPACRNYASHALLRDSSSNRIRLTLFTATDRGILPYAWLLGLILDLLIG
jgi:hypothetical protein